MKVLDIFIGNSCCGDEREESDLASLIKVPCDLGSSVFGQVGFHPPPPPANKSSTLLVGISFLLSMGGCGHCFSIRLGGREGGGGGAVLAPFFQLEFWGLGETHSFFLP